MLRDDYERRRRPAGPVEEPRDAGGSTATYLVLTDETGTNQFKYWMAAEKLAIQMPGQNTAVLFHRAQG